MGLLQPCLVLTGASSQLVGVLAGLVRISPAQRKWDKLKIAEIALGHLTSLVLCVSPLRRHEVWGRGRVTEASQAGTHSLEFIIPWVWVCHGTFVLTQVLVDLR